MKRKEKDVLDSYYGVPVTSHDIKDFTTTEERRGYRWIAIASGIGIVVFGILSLIGVQSYLAPGVWWTIALMCFSLLLVYFPIAWGPVAREARPARELAATLHPDRVDTFWYERGVRDHTPEPTLGELEEREQRRDEHRPSP
jgi:hypothetical protein